MGDLVGPDDTAVVVSLDSLSVETFAVDDLDDYDDEEEEGGGSGGKP